MDLDNEVFGVGLRVRGLRSVAFGGIVTVKDAVTGEIKRYEDSQGRTIEIQPALGGVVIQAVWRSGNGTVRKR